jgi:peptidyl-prolyl cis-trans isomerase SurA
MANFDSQFNFGWSRLVCLRVLILLGLTSLFAHLPAQAQTVLATVNRVAITDFDVQQRIRIAQLTERRKLDAKSALQELVDDQVKQLEAQRLGYRVTEDGVDGEFSRIAKLNRQTVGQFEESLRRAGIEPSAMREKFRAEISWNAISRDQARRGSDLTAAEIDQAVAEEQRKQKSVIDYQLRSVIFVVPNNAPGTAGERERAASAARARFNSCATDFADLMGKSDVAVRAPINRSSDSLSPEFAALLEKTPVDRMTPPQRSEQGIEVVAVCSKTIRDASANLRNDVITALSQKKLDARSKELIVELRARTNIQYKR